MPSYPLPPWLRPPSDLAGDYVAGLHAGAQVAEQQARLNMAAQEAEQQAAVHQQTLQMQMAREQQKLELTRAYHQAQIGLRQDQLQQTQERINLQTQRAAQKLSALSAYKSDVAGGMTEEQAALRHPEMFESMAGFGTMARQAQQKTFLPTVTNVNGVDFVQESPNRWAPLTRKQGGSDQPFKPRQVVDPATGKVRTDVYASESGQVHAWPKVKDLTKDIKAMETGPYGPFLLDLKKPLPKGEQLKAEIINARAQYLKLKAGAGGETSPAEGGSTGALAPALAPAQTTIGGRKIIYDRDKRQMIDAQTGQPILAPVSE